MSEQLTVVVKKRRTGFNVLQGLQGVTLGHEGMPWAEDEATAEERDTVDEDAMQRHTTITEPAALSRYRRRNSISLPAGLDNLAVVTEVRLIIYYTSYHNVNKVVLNEV
jgi:hypothetical protein